MDERRLTSALDELAPPVAATRGWDDVLDRARRKRRRQTRRTTVVTAAAVVTGLVAALAAGGEIGLPVSHSREPHLVAQGSLRTPAGRAVGSVQFELQRAVAAFGRRIVVDSFGRGRRGTGQTISTRWFLALAARGDSASIRPVDGHGRVVTLCVSCGARDSGRIELTPAQAEDLLNGDAAVVVADADGGRRSTAAVTLDRSHLRRGIACARITAVRVRCVRIYTGRP